MTYLNRNPMRGRHILVAAMILFVGVAGSGAMAAAFMKFDGVDGESKDSQHAGEIEILSWSWGETNDACAEEEGGSTRQTPKTDLSSMVVRKHIDKSTPKLLERCLTGNALATGTLTLREPEGFGTDPHNEVYLVIKMKPVYITSYQTGGSADEPPVDVFTLNFDEIEIEYAPEGTGGRETPETFSWNFQTATQTSVSDGAAFMKLDDSR